MGQRVETNGPANIVMAVAGNKADIPAERQVPQDEAAAYAKSINASFFETSAVTGQNVVEVFVDLGKRLPVPGGAKPGAVGAAAGLSLQSTGNKKCC